MTFLATNDVFMIYVIEVTLYPGCAHTSRDFFHLYFYKQFNQKPGICG